MGPPVSLTIAGSDSGGGAGIQADLRTFAALGVFATSVVTAVTAQNTAEVRGVEVMAASFVDLQIVTVLADLPVASVKTGMLGASATVAAVARRAANGELPNLVVDPVLVASTGRPLLDDDGPSTYLHHLFPHAVVITPNIAEATLLTGIAIENAADMARAAVHLADTGARFVVVKGGHLAGDDAPDVVLADGELHTLEAGRVPTVNDHGTGCTLSAAIAALLASGHPPLAAIAQAKEFVARALAGSAHWHLGAGRGPIDHFGWGDSEPG